MNQINWLLLDSLLSSDGRTMVFAGSVMRGQVDREFGRRDLVDHTELNLVRHPEWFSLVITKLCYDSGVHKLCP